MTEMIRKADLLRAALAELVECVEAEAALRSERASYRGAALETLKRQVEKLPATLRYAKQLLADEAGR